METTEKIEKMEKVEKASYEGVAKIRSNLEDLMARMLALKRDGQIIKGSVQMGEIVTEASVLFIDLRRENREILQEEDKIKLETEAAKAPIDQITLQLHNLLYEKNHYVKAIKTCKDFRSKYPDIDLVPEETFFQSAPQELQSDPALRDDSHKLMIQRLKFELYQRKELLKQKDILESRKKLLQGDIANRRKFLGTLASHLKTLKKATVPVQNQLGIPHTKRSKQDSLAELLPAPLYVFYTELLSRKEVFGEAIDLEIVGSSKDALTMAKQLALKEAGRKSAGSTGGRRDQEFAEDDDNQRQRKRAKKPHDKDALEKDNVYQSHPLTLTIHVYDEKQRGNKLLTLKVEFLTTLDVLCVGEEGTTLGGVSPAFSLANLFPNDPGLDLPTKASRLRAGFGFVFDAKRTLRPYKWVQYLGGKDSLPISPPQGKESRVYRQQHRVQNVLQHLRARKKAQIALKDQLDSLGKLRRPSVKSDSSLSWTSHTPKTILQAWAQVDSKNGKLSTNETSPTNRRPSNINSLTAESDTGKEDGELPSTGPTDMDVTMSNTKPAVDTSEIRRDVTEGADSMAVEGTEQGEDTAKEITSDETRATTGSEGETRQQDVEMAEAKAPNAEEETVLPSPENTPGARTFRAVLRRENGASGKRVELEAQVTIGVDYPTRAPEIRLRFLSGAPEKKPQPTSDGGGDSAMVQRDIRVVETEVNNVVPEKLPARERNYVLAHQILSLMGQFDKF